MPLNPPLMMMILMTMTMTMTMMMIDVNSITGISIVVIIHSNTLKHNTGKHSMANRI